METSKQANNNGSISLILIIALGILAGTFVSRFIPMLIAADSTSGEVTISSTAISPVFDPVSSQELTLNSVINGIVVGAVSNISNLNAIFTLNAVVSSGSSVIIDTYPLPNTDHPQRKEMLVNLTAIGTGPSTVRLTAIDANGPSQMNMSVKVVSATPNKPILFGPVSHKTVRVGEKSIINVFIEDDDSNVSDPLNIVPLSLPLGATFELNTANRHDNRYLSARIIWTPTEADVGYADITLRATNSTNAAVATIRLKVAEDGVSNAAPTLDPVSIPEIQAGNCYQASIGAMDKEGFMQDMGVEGGIVVYSLRQGSGTRMDRSFDMCPGYSPYAVNHPISFAASDQNSNTTILQIPVTAKLSPSPDSLSFGPLSDQSIYAGRALNFDISAYDDDFTASLTLAATVPPGASLTELYSFPGVVVKRISWTPSIADIGEHEVQLYAESLINVGPPPFMETNKVRGAYGTVKIKVLPPPPPPPPRRTGKNQY